MKNPYSVLFSKIPDYSLLKPFGCACFPYLKPYNRHKLQFRSTKCLFLGYGDNHKGYRCLEPTGKIYIVDTVKFNPKEFPYNSLFSPTGIASPTSSLPPTLPPFCPPPIPHPELSLQGSSYTPPNPPTSSSSNPISQQSAPTSNQLISSSQQSASSSTPPTSPSTLLPSQNSATGTTSPLISSSHHTLIHSSSPPSLIPPSRPPTANAHPMTTRSKNNIFKPKVLTVTVLPTEPKNYAAALSDPQWYSAMKDEFQALLDNKTWSLVPYDPSMKVISNKWVFRVKTFADGFLDKLKARLVARGFE